VTCAKIARHSGGYTFSAREAGFEVGNFAMGEGLYTLPATPLGSPSVGVFSEFQWWET
jgi:hypothetical protein